jgi:hypothetical protein
MHLMSFGVMSSVFSFVGQCKKRSEDQDVTSLTIHASLKQGVSLFVNSAGLGLPTFW